jgi:tol-pal system protein YbgF
MNLRTIFCVVLALPMIVSAPALAQTGDPRIAQLEEQVRRLSGTIEEMNFQVLQMQDQLRRMQEDNEFRFQQLEGGGSGSGGAPAPANGEQRGSLEQPAPVAGTQDVAGQPAAPGADLGSPPRDFGTITFDSNGNPIGAGVVEGAAQLPAQTGDEPLHADETVVASLPSGADEASVLYRNSYELILSGDYQTAEAGFRDYVERFPGSENEPDARFWLGESLLAQDRHRDAAEVFLAASRDFPQARMAPEMLYKLGVSLAEMNQRDVACATFLEVGRRYPQASTALMERVKQEQALASC